MDQYGETAPIRHDLGFEAINMMLPGIMFPDTLELPPRATAILHGGVDDESAAEELVFWAKGCTCHRVDAVGLEGSGHKLGDFAESFV
jgi:hypothetical protein